MAHTAQLKLENQEFKLIECEYEFVQPIKENGQPAGFPSGGLIHFTMEALDNRNILFYNWMQSSTEHKNGEIIFSVMDKAKITIKSLKFTRAYCIRLYEFFNGYGNTQMLTKITISATEIAFADNKVVFKNDRK